MSDTDTGGTEPMEQYEALCNNFDLARQVAQERIDEWSRKDDPHGWWHERSTYIALLRCIAELEAENERLRTTYTTSTHLGANDHLPSAPTYNPAKERQGTVQLTDVHERYDRGELLAGDLFDLLEQQAEQIDVLEGMNASRAGRITELETEVRWLRAKVRVLGGTDEKI